MTLKKMYENEIAIKFDNVDDLIEFENKFKDKNFYFSQSFTSVNIIVIFKNFKEYCFSKASFNVNGIENIKKIINYKEFIEDREVI